MANLSITNVCNKRCAYCFAGDTRGEFGDSFMSSVTFGKALDYLERSRINQARLLGGEPTLHPEFISFVRKALRRNLDIMIFTNGLMPLKVLDFLSRIPDGHLTILLNTINPDEGNPKGIEKQKKVMEKLGRHIIPGVNLYSRTFELDYVLDYFAEFDLRKEIRLGLAHVVLSRNNRFLHPKEYSAVGAKIIILKEKTDRMGIRIGFDCGFVPCMFPADTHVLLSEELKKAGNCCHPLIDLLSDGTFISCYPMNNLMKIKLDDHVTAPDLIQKFDAGLKTYYGSGIYPHCTSCPMFNTRCNGGCMSFRIQRFTH